MGRKTKKRKWFDRMQHPAGKASSEGSSPMHSDPFPTDGPADLSDGAAVIHPVTTEMMDEAAHKAAQLADDVAHHVVPPPEGDAAPPYEAPPPAMAETAGIGGTNQQQAVAREREADALRDTVAAEGREAVDIATEAVDSALVSTAGAIDDALRTTAGLVEETLASTATAAESPTPVTPAMFDEYNAALLGMVRTNVTATGDLFAALVKAKSLPEVVAIQSDHLRRQFDAMTTQGRDLATLAQNLTFAAWKPLAGMVRRDP